MSQDVGFGIRSFFLISGCSGACQFFCSGGCEVRWASSCELFVGSAFCGAVRISQGSGLNGIW